MKKNTKTNPFKKVIIFIGTLIVFFTIVYYVLNTYFEGNKVLGTKVIVVSSKHPLRQGGVAVFDENDTLYICSANFYDNVKIGDNVVVILNSRLANKVKE